MLLTITTTHRPATDLGYLLHKHPGRRQSFSAGFGQVHVFYPEATEERCTAALLLDVDPVGLVRGRIGPPSEGRALGQYVNDRPYVASSFLSVAIGTVFGSALAGSSRDRPDLAAAPLPLSATLTALPCRGGDDLLRRLFEPLGYDVTVLHHPLDACEPGWGDSRYVTLTIEGTLRLADLLRHLTVLVPVLDDVKHYWVGQDEVEKLLRRGQGWLVAHPERELIAERYLRHKPPLTRLALARLMEEDADPDPDARAEMESGEQDAIEEPISLNQHRLGAVIAVLKAGGASRVLDLGCGEGRLLGALLGDRRFTELVGMDVSYRALEVARSRLRLDRLPEREQGRVRLLHGSLTYRDDRLRGYDAAALVEVIEHLDPARLPAIERALFEFARPGTVVLTTPNAEYNAVWESLPAGRFRHRDHRFEWTRAQFEAWAAGAAERFGYRVRVIGVGPEDAVYGPPTQMAVFTLTESSGRDGEAAV
jgi:3' terminal RNA ribose 2'-O-methyltransferase Hen1